MVRCSAVLIWHVWHNSTAEALTEINLRQDWDICNANKFDLIKNLQCKVCAFSGVLLFYFWRNPIASENTFILVLIGLLSTTQYWWALCCYLLAQSSAAASAECSRYLQDRRVDLHQILQEDGKWPLVSEFFRGREQGSKRLLSLRTQLHKMQHGGKTDLLVEKRNLSDCGRIISLPNVENCIKVCRRMAEMLWCICCILHSDVCRVYTWADLGESCSGVPGPRAKWRVAHPGRA